MHDASMTDRDCPDHVSMTGRNQLKAGRRAVAHAQYIADIEGPTPEAEAKARGGLRRLRSAMNWLEDTPEFEEAHAELDRAGRFVRETFGCQFTYEDDTYWQTCPVSLAHNRVGLSPAMVIGAAECSICGKDPEGDDCPHITGSVYSGERCVRIINEVQEVLEVSLVGRPAQPDARIERMSISNAEMADHLGPSFTPGVAVNCDRCLSDCYGVARPFEQREQE